MQAALCAYFGEGIRMQQILDFLIVDLQELDAHTALPLLLS